MCSPTRWPSPWLKMHCQWGRAVFEHELLGIALGKSLSSRQPREVRSSYVVMLQVSM